MTKRNSGPPADPHTRRQFVARVAGAAALTLASSSVAWGRSSLPPVRALAFRSLHTGEELRATYMRGGAVDPGAVGDINMILRDWRTGEAAQMDLKLLDLLYALRGKLDSDAPFEVISAYRSPATNSRLSKASNGVAKRSLHMRGMAIDVHLPGRRLKDLHRAAVALKAGGVGLYSRSGFVHVDTGRVRYWGA